MIRLNGGGRTERINKEIQMGWRNLKVILGVTWKLTTLKDF